MTPILLATNTGPSACDILQASHVTPARANSSLARLQPATTAQRLSGWFQAMKQSPNAAARELQPAAGTYRPDIDGLRAIAVTGVILFHAGIHRISGGYVGVDVFFVISGFLITQILIRDLRDGRFSLARFYERRLRRILPALLVVWLASTITAAILLTTQDLLDFGRSLAASAAFISNIHFYRTSGYFDGPAIEKPLLHTWSLSVEEQYYLLWPIALWMADKWRRVVPLQLVLLGIIAASLVVCEQWLEWDSSRAFYLLPARAWELAIGALIAVGNQGRGVPPHAASLISLAGLGLILGSMLVLTPESRFPGLSAAPACIGTALMLWIGSHSRAIGVQWISMAWLRRIGLISYSLYLWHWPVLVYLRYALDTPPDPLQTSLALLLVLGLAFFSYRFIEQPLRHPNAGPALLHSRRNVLALGTLTLALVVGLGSWLDLAQGWPQRFPELVQEFERQARVRSPRSQACMGEMNATGKAEVCAFGQGGADGHYDLAIFGDSHADAFVTALELLVRGRSLAGRQVTHAGCPPLLGVTVHKVGRSERAGAFCGLFQQRMRDFTAANPHLKTVLLAARWDLYTEGELMLAEGQLPNLLSDDTHPAVDDATSRIVLARHLRDTVRFFTSRGIGVVLIGGVPPLGGQRLRCVVHRGAAVDADKRCAPSTADVMRRLAFSNHLIEGLAATEAGVTSFLPSRALCDQDICHLIAGTTYLYADDNHLNDFGVRQIAKDVPWTPPPGRP